MTVAGALTGAELTGGEAALAAGAGAAFAEASMTGLAG